MNTEPSNSLAELARILDQELLLSKKLMDALYVERAALADYDDKLITLNTSNKHQLVSDLQQLTNERLAYIEQHNIPEESLTGPELQDRFSELKRTAQICFEENQLIGQLINRRSQFIIQALDSMTPGSPINNLTYSSNGKPGPSRSYGELGIG